MKKKCETCKHFNQAFFYDSNGDGECRRYPPIPFKLGGIGNGYEYKNPVVRKSFLCGEWEERYGYDSD